MFFETSARAIELLRSRASAPVMTFRATGRHRGKALLLHKTAPLVLGRVSRFDRHSNCAEVRNLVAVLRELGFDVTLVDRGCPEWSLPRGPFDVVVGLAAGNSGRLLPRLYEACPNALKLGYCAGPEPSWSNSAIEARYRHAYRLRGRQVPKEPMRVIDQYDFKSVFEQSDALVVHGNSHTVSTYRKLLPNKQLFRVDGIAIGQPLFKLQCAGLRRGFLAVGGDGAIVKGIDLVVRAAIESPGSRFGYLGLLERDFRTLIGTEIEDAPNFREHGFVYANSKRFASIADSYSFGLLPSCSEGMATSVLTMMRRGLVPMVTEETGVDVEDFGIIVKTNHLLKDAVDLAEELDPRWLDRARTKALLASSRYSKENHRTGLSKALSQILECSE